MTPLALALALSGLLATDGDTMRAGDLRIRIWGIDAPERGEPGYRASTEALRSLITGRTLQCEAVDIDRYGRTVARCTLPDGRDLACALVAMGAADDWPRYSGGAYAGCRE